MSTTSTPHHPRTERKYFETDAYIWNAQTFDLSKITSQLFHSRSKDAVPMVLLHIIKGTSEAFPKTAIIEPTL